jgi:polygalacturonase
MIAGLTVLVSAYGAKGDNSTDNTTPFREALAEAARLGGAVVKVGSGLFKFTGNLTIPPGVTCVGCRL